MLQLFLSFSQADDQAPVGGISRFGFASMLHLNLKQALARRGLAVSIVVPAPAANAGVAAPHVDVRTPGRGAPDTFGTLLREHRIAAGLSQEALAERARMSTNGLSALERGVRRTPQRETLALLVQALALDDAARLRFEAAAGRLPAASPVNATRLESPCVADASEADLIVVVMTPAWCAEPNCRAQLARFADRRADETRNRIIVVRRERFEPDDDASVLAAATRYDFFRSAAHTREDEPLYRHDGTPSAAFYDVVDAIAQAAYRRLIPDRPARSQGHEAAPAVYVAPASRDMEAPYRTLVAELESAGYLVLPSPSAAGASDSIDADLAASVASIHLLGEEDELDDGGRSRMSYPPARAAIRAVRPGETFRRIFFAPKLFADATSGRALERDPIAVRDRFAEPVASDTIDGDGITDFVVSVKEVIRKAARSVHAVADVPRLGAGSAVFVNFHPGDVTYARSLAKALRERGIRARFAAFEDDKVQNRITNAGLVREADAVVHCWANATDAWLYAEAADYEDWRKFGRTQPFRARAAVAGPPERGSKMLYTSDDPPEAIDIYVDLTHREAPLAEDLDRIVATVDRARTA